MWVDWLAPRSFRGRLAFFTVSLSMSLLYTDYSSDKKQKTKHKFAASKSRDLIAWHDIGTPPTWNGSEQFAHLVEWKEAKLKPDQHTTSPNLTYFPDFKMEQNTRNCETFLILRLTDGGWMKDWQWCLLINWAKLVNKDHPNCLQMDL